MWVVFFRDLAFAPPLRQCWEIQSTRFGVEKNILTMFAFNIVSGGVWGHSAVETKKQTDGTANYISHVGVRFLGMSGR